MPDTSFIPRQDANALLWMQAFVATVSPNPGTYFMSAADAASVAAAVDDFANKLAIATTEGTRTKVSVAAKDVARNAAEQICRQFAMLIKYNAGISDEDKISAGIRPVNNEREPIECPQTSPLVNVIASTPGAQTIRFADSMTPDSAAKPFGASELQLFVAIAAGPVVDPDAAKFIGKYTKNPIAVAFDAEDNGKQATYFARWASRRGQTGPWSAPVSLAIAA